MVRHVRLVVLVCVAVVACSGGPDDVFGGWAHWEETGDGERVMVGGPWPVSDGRGYHRSAEGLGSTDAPEGEFVDVSVGWFTACGVRVGGEMECWGHRPVVVPDGEFAKVWVDSSGSCALDAEGSVVCWDFRVSPSDTNSFAEFVFPEGEFVDVSGGCGVQVDGQVQCWGPKVLEEIGHFDVPEGEFVRVGGGCAQRADSSWTCRVDGAWAEPPAEAGQLTQIVGGEWHRCGLRIDAAMVCWDPPTGELMDNPFEEPGAIVADASSGTETVPQRFADLGSGSWASHCAITSDAKLVCADWQPTSANWHDREEACVERAGGGNEEFGRTICEVWGYGVLSRDIPGGQFTKIDIPSHAKYACGLRVDRTIACWGRDYPDGLRSPVG